MRPFLSISAIILLLSGLISCQKVIEVNLNESNPALIIEAQVTDAPGPYFVQLSLSKNFDEDNNFPPVRNAFVLITDKTIGYTDTLTEITPGQYQTLNLQGVPGHTYELLVQADGHTYTSVSTMPSEAVDIDSIYVRKSDFGGDVYFIVPVYTDPPGKGHRYLIRQYINGQIIKGTTARSDEVTDGELSEFPLYYNTEDGNRVIRNGDSITVELLMINQEVYDFFRTLEATISSASQNAGTPANPLTNIKGGAMGVFNTAIIRSKSAIASF